MTDRAPEVALPVAGLFGVVSGSVVYQFLLPDWFPALATAATYAGAAYFYLAFDIPLLGMHIEFTDRADRAGYAVGLFGVSVGPLALGEYVGLSNSGVIGVVVWQVGLLAFLLLSATAVHRRS
ncbi:hypothetical protein [Haloplanus pelagicus]|uniref:hypothetical protein n=1 Tax=Haloplanus pelagicus TaxID=2949995 RepID=UPI00203DADC5|nr:hypothetical protein [Haloplanus sp. HW8-1]